ncbi:MAG: oxidoreductase [Spirochaetes bacterium]|nr:oxidoreductase [Spirochaetota bacterium]
MKKTAIIAGASGLVGGHCLHLLLDNDTYDTVIAPVRKKFPLEHPKLRQHVVEFDNLGASAGILRGDELFCCLGSTMKKAGSREAFRKVDFEYPKALAELALENGVKRFLIVTALGADPHSKIFYNRVKGEVEMVVRALPFESVHIFRPSMLLGERSESRPAEKIGGAAMRALSFLMLGPLKNYRAIRAEDVARAMVSAAGSGSNGVVIHESGEMQRKDTRA